MQLPNELKQAIDNNAFCALATKMNEKEIQNHLMSVSYTHLTLPTILLV